MTATTFDPAAKSARITLSNGNLTATADATNSYGTVKSTRFDSTGKWYAEFTIGTLGTTCYIGISNSALSVDLYVGYTGGDGYGYRTSAFGDFLYNGSTYGSGGSTCVAGDVVGVLFDADNDTLEFSKNGSLFGSAIATGVTGAWSFALSTRVNTAVTVNFGASAWVYSPPAGYTGFDSPLPGSVGIGAGTIAQLTASGARIAAGAGTLELMTAGGGRNGFGEATMSQLQVAGTGGSNFGELTLEPLTAEATGRQANIGTATMESLTATGTGYDSSISTVAVTALVPTISAEVLTGFAITFAGTAPAPIVEIGFKDARLVAPASTLSATALTGAAANADFYAPSPTLVAVLDNPAIITVSGSARVPVLVAETATGSIITAAFSALAPQLTSSGLTGNASTFAGSAVAPILLAAGYPAYTLTFAGKAPVPYISSTMSGAVTAAFRTWALNTRKGALTEYSNFSFNSFATFNGVVLGCGASGIVTLGTQDADGSTAISSTVKSGADNFGNSHIKRVPRIYLDYKTDGGAQFKMITVEGGSRTYNFAWNSVTGTQQRRVPVGKGPKSARWQWEYTNVAGADFGINAVLAYPTATRRRVQ